MIQGSHVNCSFLWVTQYCDTWKTKYTETDDILGSGRIIFSLYLKLSISWLPDTIIIYLLEIEIFLFNKLWWKVFSGQIFPIYMTNTSFGCKQKFKVSSSFVYLNFTVEYVFRKERRNFEHKIRIYKHGYSKNVQVVVHRQLNAI